MKDHSLYQQFLPEFPALHLRKSKIVNLFSAYKTAGLLHLLKFMKDSEQEDDWMKLITIQNIDTATRNIRRLSMALHLAFFVRFMATLDGKAVNSLECDLEQEKSISRLQTKWGNDFEEFMALEKINEVEKELTSMMRLYGRPGLYDDWVRFQAEARKKRREEEVERKQQRAKNMEYVEAASLRGEGRLWVIFREILPNALSPLVAELGLRFIFMVLFISTLSFLGLGVQPPLADWGGIVKENKDGIIYGIGAALYPAIAIATLAISVNLVADWVLNRTTSLKGGRG